MAPVRTLAEQLAFLSWWLVIVHRDPKKGSKPKLEDFNPYESDKKRKTGIPLTRENIGLLKKAFVKKRAFAERPASDSGRCAGKPAGKPTQGVGVQPRPLPGLPEATGRAPLAPKGKKGDGPCEAS